MNNDVKSIVKIMEKNNAGISEIQCYTNIT